MTADPADFERRDARDRAFFRRWRADVAPVHERTERSREFRAGYARLALTSLSLANGGALLTLPAVARLAQASFAGHMRPFLLAEGLFFVGLLLVLKAMILAYLTLDADVVRQKGERAAARARLRAEFPEQFPEAPEAERVRSESEQSKYWRVGVGLSWATVAVVTGSLAALAAGGVFAARFLAAATG